MKVAIIGLGFVGNALQNGLMDTVKVKKIDPKLGTNINELKDFSPEIIFICVPTPMSEDKTQDISIVESVVDEINDLRIPSLVVLKSTLLPNYVKKLGNKISRFIYNPEFLREKHADEDFVNSELIVFGGDKDETKYLSEFYQEHTKCTCKDHIFTDLLTASFIKYTINTFLSVKVIFFNELKELFDASGTSEDWENFTKYISTDKRIGESHMQVPGHDGRLGFGGACLPKDSDAFIKYANQIEKQLILLNNAIKLNNDIRSSYNKETDREFEQNTRFRGDD
jgi:nucleotide sugar dehydrogenase